MKKLICIFMAALVCLSVFPFYCFADSDELNLTVTTDIHLKSPEECGDLTGSVDNEVFIRGMVDSDLFYHVSQQGQMNNESKAIIASMLNSFKNSDSKYLLIAGDLTGGGKKSHLLLKEMLKDTEQGTDKHIFVVPGNHDCAAKSSEDKISIDEFKELYADFGYSEAIAKDTSSGTYVAELEGKYRLLAIDSCIYSKDDGQITKSVLKFIEEQVKAAEKDGKHLVAMMHHSILPHFTVQPMISDYAKYATKFADWGIKFVFTGHIHANDITSAVSKKGNTVYDIQTGSLITSPCAYRNVSITDDSVAIKSEYVSAIDTSLLTGGYSAEQLALIQNDFTQYAHRYFENGICRWLNRYIGSAYKVGKTLKLKEGSGAFNALNSLMMCIGDAMALPVYGEEGETLQSIAGLAGESIPASNYQYFYQIAASVMGGFYRGDENNEAIVPLVLACVKAILAKSITDMLSKGFDDSKIISAVENLTQKSIKETALTGLAKANFSSKLAETVIVSVVTPVLNGLINDLSTPDDINTTLPGFNKESSEKAPFELSFFKRAIAFIKQLFSLIFGKGIAVN